MYARVGRPSIAPEKLLRAQLLQMLYSIRSERFLMEEMDYNPAVPLVCGAECGRRSLGCDHLHQEPGPIAGGGCGSTWCACGTWAWQFRRCNSGSTCVRRHRVRSSSHKNTRKSNRSTSSKMGNTKKNTRLVNFSAAC